jgi:hypothetical protein
MHFDNGQLFEFGVFFSLFSRKMSPYNIRRLWYLEKTHLP